MDYKNMSIEELREKRNECKDRLNDNYKQLNELWEQLGGIETDFSHLDKNTNDLEKSINLKYEILPKLADEQVQILEDVLPVLHELREKTMQENSENLYQFQKRIISSFGQYEDNFKETEEFTGSLVAWQNGDKFYCSDLSVGTDKFHIAAWNIMYLAKTESKNIREMVYQEISNLFGRDFNRNAHYAPFAMEGTVKFDTNILSVGSGHQLTDFQRSEIENAVKITQAFVQDFVDDPDSNPDSIDFLKDFKLLITHSDGSYEQHSFETLNMKTKELFDVIDAAISLDYEKKLEQQLDDLDKSFENVQTLSAAKNIAKQIKEIQKEFRKDNKVKRKQNSRDGREDL